MPIVCLEGPSAVGKSTISKRIESTYSAKRIPEVNELFSRPRNEPKKWYLEKQIERWNLAREASRSYELVLLDGDTFQPLWYNWIYTNANLQPLEEVINFYSNAIQSSNIEFPDKYFVLSTGIEELQSRKKTDKSRRRHNFEKHLIMIEPQREYFTHMKDFHHEMVDFLESSNVEVVVNELVKTSTEISSKPDSQLLFDRQKKYVSRDA